MPIQLTKSRRGLYDLEEYITYRGEFKDSSDNLIPLPDGYEPIIYMKCLINSHQYPFRPETGERVIGFQEFMEQDFTVNPFSCPACGERDIKFKFCLLEDQPRTFNDPNHKYIKTHRDRTLILHHSMYYGKAEQMFGRARPYWEDYFPPGHTNHNDPFAELEVQTTPGPDQKFTDIFSSNAVIAQALSEEDAVPPEDVYDNDNVYIIRHKGDDMPALPKVTESKGMYLFHRKNYDFYRAILYIVTQYNITI